MALLFTLPRVSTIDLVGEIAPRSRLYFYQTGTSTPQPVYADSGLTTALAQPATASDAGLFRAIYLDDSLGAYKIVCQDEDGAELWTVDPYLTGPSQAQIGAALYPRTDAETAAGVTPSNRSYPPGHFQRYGADPTGVADSTTAINNAIACSGVSSFSSRQYAYCDGGEFRIDGTVVVDDYQTCYLRGGKLIRKSSGSASTDQVLHIKGTQAVFDGGGGSVWSENESPDGVVACGHSDRTTSNYNSLWWKFLNTWVYCKDFGGSSASPYPDALDGVGVYVPSSQPQLGSSFVNYFGLIQNVVVHTATTAFMLTDLANGHTLDNCSFRGFYHYGFRLHGAYGNIIRPGFCEIGYKDGVIAVLLSTKLAPSAPHVSSLESMRNTIERLPIELGGINQVGIRCEAGCQYNNGGVSFNATGTAVLDLDGANEFDSDTTLASNKNFTLTGLTAMSRSSNEIVRIESSHASGPYVALRRSGNTVGFLGSSLAVSATGSTDDLQVAAIANKDLRLTTSGTGRVRLVGGGYSLNNVPAYADDAAAAAGGLAIGDVYRTASALKVRVS